MSAPRSPEDRRAWLAARLRSHAECARRRAEWFESQSKPATRVREKLSVLAEAADMLERDGRRP